jgi:hypothetical protein
LTNLYVSESAVIFSWDGKRIGKVLPADSGKRLKFKVNTSKGCHQLTFCPEGCETEKIHQGSIKNVVIYEKQCVGGWGKDIIKNGGFEQNSCKSASCIFNSSQYSAAFSPVPSWTASPAIEIGRGNVYNRKLGTSWVSDLDAKPNTCIKQKVPLQPGRALL